MFNLFRKSVDVVRTVPPVIDMQQVEKRGQLLAGGHPSDPALVKFFAAPNSASGVYVDADLAQSIPTFYACIKAISEDIGKLPLLVYRKNGDKREEATDHPLYKLLTRRPNGWQTPMEFKQQLSRSYLMRGNAYAEIIMDRRTGQSSDLIPLNPDRVTAFLAPNGQRAYHYRPHNGASRIILQSEMLHLMGASDDGITGRSVLDDAAHTLGLAYSTMDYGAKFFSNGARPGGVLEHPGQLGPEAMQNIRKSWNDAFRGTQNAHNVAVVEEGMTFKEVSMTAEDAQFIESRKLSPVEICQFFRMPPHKVGILDKATFSNIEQQDLEYVGDTLLSHLIRFEEVCHRDLLKTEKDQASLYLKFDPEVLLRGDKASRYSSYAVGINTGFLSKNEARKKEDMNPIEGGDEYLTPLNMTPTTNPDGGSVNDPTQNKKNGKDA